MGQLRVFFSGPGAFRGEEDKPAWEVVVEFLEEGTDKPFSQREEEWGSI
jgi:hypothetical protein